MSSGVVRAQAAVEQVQPAVRQASGGQGRLRLQRAEWERGAGGGWHTRGAGAHRYLLTHHPVQVPTLVRASGEDLEINAQTFIAVKWFIFNLKG